MKVLVAIAHYGTKNREFLERLLAEYRSMPGYATDIVVFTETAKPYLPADVRQVIGLPHPDPWSLPFGHRKLFIDQLPNYEVFIYTEDDTLLQARHLDAFLAVSRSLPPDRVPGFLRYELDGQGERSFNDVHSHYHWDPLSPFRHDGEIYAHFTNVHSACYVLTRSQLQRCVDSGGFLTEPHAGRYDMLVTAATDPYTRCGMAKVIPLSRFNDFVLHHLPNVYLGRMGISDQDMKRQLDVLRELADMSGERRRLFPVSTMLTDDRWDRVYYEPLSEPLRGRSDLAGRTVLAFGVGAGQAEAELISAGARVVGVPLDPVIATSARRRHIELLPMDLRSVLHETRGEIDAVLLSDVLPHLERPVEFLLQVRTCLSMNGEVWVSARNATFDRARWALRHHPRPPRQASFPASGVHPVDARVLTRWLRAAGYVVGRVDHWSMGQDSLLAAQLSRFVPWLTSDRVLVTARCRP